jgi:hypothetical protein
MDHFFQNKGLISLELPPNEVKPQCKILRL